METISAGDPKAAARAAEVLRKGGVILYPTDTVYGLGVDALSAEAVKKIFTLKGRSAASPVSVVVEDLRVAGAYAMVNDSARTLAEAFWPGPLTIVLRKRESVPPELVGERETLGLRVPNDSFCRSLAKEFGKPYTTTSANRAGTGDCRSVADALASLSDHAGGIDLVIDGGRLPATKPSTVVDVSGAIPHIFREGAIPKARVLEALAG